MFGSFVVTIFGTIFLLANCKSLVKNQTQVAILNNSRSDPDAAISTLPLQIRSEVLNETTIPEVCVLAKVCSNDSDCAEGQCVGIAVGKCNCAACIPFLSCTSDMDCGGLQNSCNSENYCNCEQGYQQAGFANTVDAWFKLCNQVACYKDSDTCFGLPCNTGTCICPVGPDSALQIHY